MEIYVVMDWKRSRSKWVPLEVRVKSKLSTTTLWICTKSVHHTSGLSVRRSFSYGADKSQNLQNKFGNKKCNVRPLIVRDY